MCESGYIIPSVVPRSAVHDSVAEAGVVRYQKSPTRSKVQFETAKSSSSGNHTFTMISKTVGNFGTIFCYLKRFEKHCMASIWQRFVRVFAGRNPSMILRKVLNSEVK